MIFTWSYTDTIYAWSAIDTLNIYKETYLEISVFLLACELLTRSILYMHK